LNLRRVLPYIIGLIALTFALGSLTRGTSGGNLLFRAYWLLYLIYLSPVLILGATAAFVILVGLNYRDIGAALGYGMAKRRQMRKPGSRYLIFVQMFFWALAIGVVIYTKGSILNSTHGVNSTLVRNIVGEKGTAPDLTQNGGFLPAISNLWQNSWFSLAFLAVLVVGGLVLVQSVRVALKEMHDVTISKFQGNQEQGLQAVQEAIKLVEDSATDPRSRIISCYQHLISAVSGLGAPISSDLTARELDRAVRSTFALRGPETTDLTQLFEEARYSLHAITADQAAKAHELLESVADELQIQLKIAP
jgi:Domain of unknown function (DUF4129)